MAGDFRSGREHLTATIQLRENRWLEKGIDGVPALREHGVPLLVIHGEADTTVPGGHGRRIAAAYGEGVETLYVPEAEHVRAFEIEPRTYIARLTGFFDRAE